MYSDDRTADRAAAWFVVVLVLIVVIALGIIGQASSTETIDQEGSLHGANEAIEP
jgi:hypothetical protein